MLSIIVIASFVLPSVGGCCLPDKFSASATHVETQVSGSVLVDFTQNKFIVRRNGGDNLFTLTDWNAGKQYTGHEDGSCSFVAVELPPKQCIPVMATVESVFLNGHEMDAYTWSENERESTFVMTKDTCLPAKLTRRKNAKVSTSIYANIDSNVTDVSDLDLDISGCWEENSFVDMPVQ